MQQISPNEGEIILVNKPLYFTSFEIVNYYKNKLYPIKIGHAGTLDPMATGLLILCTGNFTKRISEFQELHKTYEGQMTLGFTTESFDRETKTLATNKEIKVDNDTLKNIIAKFSGEIMQNPPVHSAVKIGGTRSYNWVKRGKVIIPGERKITIYKLELELENNFINFKVECSKGTYIRALVNDIGIELGCGAYMNSLTRTRIGNFQLEDAEQIENLDTNNSKNLKEKIARILSSNQ